MGHLGLVGGIGRADLGLFARREGAGLLGHFGGGSRADFTALLTASLARLVLSAAALFAPSAAA
jgi:preprotein translocase subunit SecG